MKNSQKGRKKNCLFLSRMAVLFILQAGVMAKELAPVPLGRQQDPWRFGVIGDTQWPVDDGSNPNTVAVGIIHQVDKALIEQGAKFVIQVGDLTDNGSPLALDTRATYAQDLYNAGRGFFPLRGNHESEAKAAREFQAVFPQTQNGLNNNTPSGAFISTQNAIQPPAKQGAGFFIGHNFSTPGKVSGLGDMTGLSYAFDHENARFLLLDQFTPLDGGSEGAVDLQQPWIASALSGRPAGQHAFVFSHKGLVMENHSDCLFGKDPSQHPEATDVFMDCLHENGVRYLICGHDHLHQRSLVSNTKGRSSLTQLTSASCSYKFYGSADPSVDETYNLPAFGLKRELPLDQDLYRAGYYLFTIEGPKVSAVTRNTGGVKRFVWGSYRSGYGLGTYGVDPANHTAWAVLNGTDAFAVAPGI